MPFNSNFERKTRKDKLMSLITCKKSRGGGNSLKLRGKSEKVRVGGSSSSGRFGGLLAFLFSVAFSFAFGYTDSRYKIYGGFHL